uniref:Immunoglobulin V-set domain-containing protein n=1 Tax=Xenopus tropicalis TaxID=8364 RepID=A0A803JSJ1_XENTR
MVLKMMDSSPNAVFCLQKLWSGVSDAESQTLSLTLSNNAVNLGERATFTCHIGTKDGSQVLLIKQVPGNAPQLIIYHHHSFTSPRYGPGISTDRYTATINSEATEYQFIIKKAETADTAHYYCVKWFSSISASHSDTESDKNTA